MQVQSLKQGRRPAIAERHQFNMALRDAALFNSHVIHGGASTAGLRRMLDIHGPVKTAEHVERVLKRPSTLGTVPKSDIEVRTAVISTLGRLRDPRLVPLLQNHALSAEDPRVRRSAVLAIGQMRTTAMHAAPALRQIVARDSAFYVREAALSALTAVSPTAKVLQLPLRSRVRFSLAAASA